MTVTIILLYYKNTISQKLILSTWKESEMETILQNVSTNKLKKATCP